MATDPMPSGQVPRLDYVKLWFELRQRGEAELPPYLGSTLRGGLAWAMRRISCVARRVKACRECQFVYACSYALLFETNRPQWAERYPTMNTIPHPMVIEPPLALTRNSAGDILSFEIILFGRAVEHWPYLVVAARAMAMGGLGKRKARFELKSVNDTDRNGTVLYDGTDIVRFAVPTVSHAVYDDSTKLDRVRIEFLTPTRLVEQGRVLRRPSWSAIVRSLAFRTATIAYFHAGVDWDPTPIEQSALSAPVDEMDSEIVWWPMKRFSSRQEQEVPIAGFTGHVVYQGPGIAVALPLLRLGEVLHVGKNTVFGLGRFRVTSAL